VRLGGWWVDGFGALRDYEIGGLDPALTVLIGANEAGKSTQLAFLRYVLFGFPKRSTNLPQYEPARGGTHGGRVTLLDGAERHELWRYKSDKSPRLVGPDGEAGEEALARLLGHADAGLFRSVFAFGLTELQSFDALNEEAVRQHIFSAGVVGAGRSARDASRRLGKRVDELLRGSQGKARINDLLREIEARDAELRGATHEAASYGERVDQERSAQAVADEVQEQLAAARSHKAHLVRLAELWPRWDLARQGEVELARLPVLDPQDVDTLRSLARELPVRRDRLTRCAEARREADEAERIVKRAFDELGPGWTEEGVDACDLSIPVRDEVRQWEQRLSTLANEEAETRRVEATVAQRVAELQADRDQRAGRLPETPPPPLADIEAHEVLLARLREERGASRAADVAPATRSAALPRALPAALGALAVALAVIGATRDAGGAGWLIAAAVALALALALGAGRRREAAPTSRLRELKARTAERAAALGLAPEPTDDEVDRFETRLRAERTARIEYEASRRELDDAVAALERATAALDARRQASETASAQLAMTQDQWRAYKLERGLPETLSVEGAAEFFTALGRCHQAGERRAAAREQAAALEAETRRWEEAARAVVTATGGEVAGLDAAGLERAVEEAFQAAARRDELERRVSEVDDGLRERFGDGDEAARVRVELAEGDPGLWSSAAEEADTAVAELDQRYADTIRQHQDARRAREELERSADIPRLQGELESLRAELDDAVAEYRELKLAQALVDHTLREFMRTRQPAVLAAAGAAFARLTEGRYTAVVQPDDLGDDLRVVGADGAEKSLETLSRGTAEQLYLCLRLGLAREFAGRSVALPFVMDDCLVNFDPARAATTADLLLEFSAVNQVLLFTCHPETVALLDAAAGGGLTVVEL
jgi:uncharacterized protein YhaN